MAEREDEPCMCGTGFTCLARTHDQGHSLTLCSEFTRPGYYAECSCGWIGRPCRDSDEATDDWGDHFIVNTGLTRDQYNALYP